MRNTGISAVHTVKNWQFKIGISANLEKANELTALYKTILKSTSAKAR